jgi:non-specific serine/threonine protein kinase/serine/threonine-protein kinase
MNADKSHPDPTSFPAPSSSPSSLPGDDPTVEPSRGPEVAQAPAAIPARIGEYAIRRVIASGGMGVVYEAMQENPRRPVALKVMKRGLASRSALRRFEFESQILGRLRHPSIAQVYEAGVHTDGPDAALDPHARESLPYFVMEYIPAARTLTQYAYAYRLSTRDRLDLFARVCDGVHHGHQKGVIHRDLKPANILVDSSGVPKIIDFGVARTTDSDLVVTTLQTDVGQLIGTLQYMSPEQVEADPNDLDVRSDVYSLGVVLYELLTGVVPYNVMNRTVVEAGRLIREQAPKRLSTVDHTLRGDVETITLKAMQKDREARYQSALELAQDIRRYLSNEPISARPPSLLYQIRVFARRNTAAFTAIVAIVLVSIAAAVVSGLFARQALHARDDANEALAAKNAALVRVQQEADANKAAGDFMRDVLALASPQRAMGKQYTVREALDIAAANVTAGTTGQPLAEAGARVAIGATYRALGLYQQAHEHLSKALEIRRRERGPEHQETLAVITELAAVIGDLNRSPEAIDMMSANLATQQRVLGPLNVDTLRTTNALAWLRFGSGELEEAERLFRISLDGFRRALGPESPPTIKAKTNIAMALASQGKVDLAQPLAREAADEHERLLGRKNPDTMYARNICAWTLMAGQRAAEAEPIWREVVTDATEVMGADHPYRLYWLNSLAWCVLEQGKFDQAEPMFAETSAKREVVLAEGHPDTFSAFLGYVKALAALKRFEQAEPIALKWHAAAVPRLGSDAFMTREFAAVLADVYEALGRPNDAAPYRQQAAPGDVPPP